MNKIRIGCLSYVPLGYGTPQIVHLVRSLAAHYEPREPIAIFEPDWGTHLPQHARMPDFTFCRFDKADRGHDEHYSAERWIDARRPDLLVVTHFKYLRALAAARHRPAFVLFYNFENPSEDERPAAEDSGHLSRAHELVSFSIYTEENRRRLMHEAGYLGDVPSVVLYNAPPLSDRPAVPAAGRNGRLLYQGTIDFKRTYIDFLCRPERPPLPCDIFGAIPAGNLAECIRRKRVQQQAHVRPMGMVPMDELAEARRQYSYSLVMWKPLSENYLYACPNKFFESIASGVPPIAAPHPQCAEILRRYDCGVLLDDWSFDAFSRGTRQALDWRETADFARLAENCALAHHAELNWEAQFARLSPHLPPARPSAARTASRTKFCLVDPSLFNEVGHHYVYGAGVLKAALLEGLEPIAAVNRMLAAPLDPEVVLHPVFCNDFWGRLVRAAGYGAGRDAPFSFVAGLRQVFARESLGERDHVFIPNISDEDLKELADALAADPALRAAHWHIFIRHEMPSPAPQLRFARAPYPVRRAEAFVRNVIAYAARRDWPRAVSIARINAAMPPGRVRYYTDTAELADHHRWGFEHRLAVLPIPAAIRSSDYHTAPNDVGEHGLTVVYSGDARQEKGFHLLPGIVVRLQDLLKDGRVRIRIQAHHPHGDPVILAAREELRSLAATIPLELIERPLPEDEYLDLVRTANVLLAIYDARHYRCRSSHVFIEGVANNKPVVVCRGTSMAKMLPRGSRWTCPDGTGADRVIRFLAGDWPAAAAEAADLGRKFRNFHTSQKLVQMLVERRTPDPADASGQLNGRASEPALPS